MPRGRKEEPKGPDWPPEKTLPLLKEQLRQLQGFKGKTFSEVERNENEWEQFTRSVIIHGFGEGSENLGNHYSARSAGIHNLMGVSVHQRQLNFEERIAQYEATLNSSIRELEASLPAPVSNAVGTSIRDAVSMATRTRSDGPLPDADQPLVLVSHSSKDVELASALVDFLRAGLLINRIRCSSVDGYRLPAGVNTDSQLRTEVNSSNVLIGLITPNSLASAYVMFELGARWGAGSFMIPLLAGVTAAEIRGPLSGLNALCANNESQLHQLLTDVARPIGITVQNAASYVNQLSMVKVKASDLKPLIHEAARVEESRKDFRLNLAVVGEPPSQQMLKVRASRPVRAVRLEYLLSTGVCLATDSIDIDGESFDIPIQDQQVLKLWNTPRTDRDHNDHSGPAKLRVTLSVGGRELSYTLPVQMDSHFHQNTSYRKLVGSEVFQ